MLEGLKNRLREKLDYFESFISESFLDEDIDVTSFRKSDVESEDYCRGRTDQIKEVLGYINKLEKQQGQQSQRSRANENYQQPRRPIQRQVDYEDDVVDYGTITPNNSGRMRVERWEDSNSNGGQGGGGVRPQDNLDNILNYSDVVDDDVDLDDYWYKKSRKEK